MHRAKRAAEEGGEGPTQDPPRRRPALLVVALAVAAVLVVGGLLVAFELRAPAGCPSATPPPGGADPNQQVLAGCGTEVVLAAHSHQSVLLPRLSDSMAVAGLLQANLSVGVFVMNTSELGGFAPNGTSPPAASYWTCASGPSCEFTVVLLGSPAQFFFVLQNTHASNLSLTWKEPLTLYYGASPTYRPASFPEALVAPRGSPDVSE